MVRRTCSLRACSFKVRWSTVTVECIPFQSWKEVKRYSKDYVAKGRALGELGHPDGPTVNLDRVSHKITELKQDGNNFIGKAQILHTLWVRLQKHFSKMA